MSVIFTLVVYGPKKAKASELQLARLESARRIAQAGAQAGVPGLAAQATQDLTKKPSFVEVPEVFPGEMESMQQAYFDAGPALAVLTAYLEYFDKKKAQADPRVDLGSGYALVYDKVETLMGRDLPTELTFFGPEGVEVKLSAGAERNVQTFLEEVKNMQIKGPLTPAGSVLIGSLLKGLQPVIPAGLITPLKKVTKAPPAPAAPKPAVPVVPAAPITPARPAEPEAPVATPEMIADISQAYPLLSRAIALISVKHSNLQIKPETTRVSIGGPHYLIFEPNNPMKLGDTYVPLRIAMIHEGAPDSPLSILEHPRNKPAEIDLQPAQDFSHESC